MPGAVKVAGGPAAGMLGNPRLWCTFDGRRRPACRTGRSCAPSGRGEVSALSKATGLPKTGVRLTVLLGIVLLFSAAVAQRIYSKHYHLLLGRYFFNPTRLDRSGEPLDIIYSVVDHWEPGHLNEARSFGIVETWMTGYRELANRHVDSDGRNLQHTFFYPRWVWVYQVDSLVTLRGRPRTLRFTPPPGRHLGVAGAGVPGWHRFAAGPRGAALAGWSDPFRVHSWQLGARQFPLREGAEFLRGR